MLDFALKNYLYTVQQKVFLNIVNSLFKSFEVLHRSGKIKSRSKEERIFVPGGRKKVLSRLLDFALKLKSLYILTKGVFQYKEELIQII